MIDWDAAYKKHLEHEKIYEELDKMGQLSPLGPTKTVYKVNWDNGANACGTFPQMFDTEEAADDYGAFWAREMNDEEGLDPEVDEDCYSYDVIEVEVPDPDAEYEDYDRMCRECRP